MRGILLFLLFPSVLFAQSTLPKGENRFSRLSIEDGLSQMGVLDILQDRKGFVWIATRDGLNRYDGQNFVVYRKKRGDTTSLNHNRIWSLAQSDGGNVWVGTNYGLAKFSYQTNRFSRFVPFPGQPYDLRNTIRAILCLHDGRLLVGTENGALVFDSGTGTFDVQTLEETAGSFVKDFLLVRESQEVYVATNRGLFQYNQNLELERHYLNLLPDQERTTPIQVHALYQDTQDRIWVGTEKGVHQYHADQGHFSYFHNPLADEGTFPVLDIEEDEHGTLWIAASYLYSFEEDHYEAYYPHDPADETSISGNYVTCITKSSDGVLWMGSDRFGVNIFNPAAYPFEYMGQYATADRGLGNSFVTAIQPTPDGKVLVGTATTLDLISIETERRYRSHQNPLPLGSNPLWVLDILPHKNGSQYWLATMIGVGLYDYPTGTITYPLADQLGHRVNRVEALNQDELLVSTHGAGLYRYNYERDQLTKITSENPQHVNLAQGLVRSTLVVGDSVWIGTERGLYLYHLPTGAVQQFVHDPTDSTSLPEDYIKHIFQDRSGTLWLGTWGGGIAKLLPESQTFVTYGLDQGLPNQVVYGILQDEAGYLWCSSNVGISRFDPVKEEFLNFDAEDGLQGNEFNTGAFHQAEDGTLFFGGVNGFNWFDPTDIQPISSPPTTVITEFYLDNKLVEPGSNSVLQRNILETDTVILNWRQNNFAVRVAALDYASNQPNTFRYCLDGHETLWRSLGSLDYFNYTSIDPGWYTLQVQAASRNGVWAPESRKLVIHITEPFWRNRGVQVGAIALFVGLLFFLNYLYIRNRRWRTEQLENMVLERTRTIQEQKEELGTAHQEMEQQNVELQRAAENLETSNEELRQL
ncbi:MAG: two-component regulator propeller domain-containing protein, partial [Bacteroidota bacterium]